MEILKTTTVKQLLKLVNDAVQQLVGTKQSADDFHRFVEKSINPVLEPYGLLYTSWSVVFEGKLFEKLMWEEILQLDIERVDDKRTNHHPIWTNTSLSFTSRLEGVDPSMSLYDLLIRVQIAKAEVYRQSANNNIEDFKSKIIHEGGRIAEYDREIDLLKSELEKPSTSLHTFKTVAEAMTFAKERNGGYDFEKMEAELVKRSTHKMGNILILIDEQGILD